jgi:hypothetical protein
MNDVTLPITSVERQVADLRVDTVSMLARIDRVKTRLDQIEKRLGSIDA